MAFDLARDIAGVAATTIASKKREFDMQLTALLTQATGFGLARELQAQSCGRGTNSDQLRLSRQGRRRQ
jgi:hypothetical protein